VLDHLVTISGANPVEIIYILDLFGTFTFAVSGALSAAGKRLDLFGALSIGFVTAVGGGTVRDLTLGTAPVFWLRDVNYLLVIAGGVFIIFLFARHVLAYRRVLLVFDAIGIGVFTLIGINKALGAHVMPVFAVLMGVITAVVGGVLRDVLVNEVPLIFQREIYATACLMGGAVYFLLAASGVPQPVVYFATAASVIALRLLSIRYELGLPVVKVGKGDK
jgi:uncharacterized membrane protein YeiH